MDYRNPDAMYGNQGVKIVVAVKKRVKCKIAGATNDGRWFPASLPAESTMQNSALAHN